MVKINKDIIIDGTNKTLGDLANSSSSNNYLPITGGTLTGNLTLKGSNNYGTKINLGDGDYVHFYEVEDDVLEIKASEIRLASTGIKLDGDDYFYAAGDTLVIDKWVTFAGIVTSGTTQINFVLYTPKSMKHIGSVTCTTFKAEARSSKGYINSTSGFQNFLGSGYRVDAVIVNDHTLSIYIVKSSAFTNVDNNTIVGISVQSGGGVVFRFNS